MTALGDYDAAAALFRQIIRSGPESRRPFEDWCAKYVFDTLEAGRSWHPPDRKPAGTAFLPMVEAEETYRNLSAKAERVIVDGFTTRWSPDGKKLAFSMGFVGYNGVALYDLATGETELLIVPGKDPVWSPDGRYIAFVRDCPALRVPEFATAKRGERQRPKAEEEVWVIKSDGTEPRRLARGGWPSWSQDSKCVYYHSRLDNALYSISLEGRPAKPEWIIACPDSYPALSQHGQRVAYREGGLLRVRDLPSQTIVAQWPIPPFAWGGPAWSPNGTELCMGTTTGAENNMGLWVYGLGRGEPLRTLDGQITAAFWSPDGTKLVFHRGAPFFEVWTAEIDPNVSLAEALGSAQTRDEYFQDLVALWTRRIAADPADPYNYFHRAAHYRSLQEDAKLRADGRRYWAALHPGWPAGFRFRGPWSIMQTVNGPLDYQLVVFFERQEDGMQLLRIAFGQKGRCEMKSFEIPMVLSSLLGLCFLAGPDVPTARADFTFGPRVNLGATVNSPQGDGMPIASRDGLELYFCSDRPGGYGDWDIWMSKRARMEDSWGPPVNLGPGVNSTFDERPTSVSSDGLTLYSHVWNGQHWDLYTATRPTRDASWGPRVNLGPALNRNGFARGADIMGVISADDLTLFFGSSRPGAMGGSVDIYVTTRATPADPWGPPVNLGSPVNTSQWEVPGPMSPDGLVLFMAAENRPGGLGGYEVWMTRRPSKDAAWTEPVRLGMPSGILGPVSLSPDGQWGYFTEHPDELSRTGDLWMAPLIPTVDFNAEGKADLIDMVMLIDNWGTSQTLCDIGPFAWGDGKVDIEDLKVFMTYYEKANPLAQGNGATLLDFVPTAGSPEGVAVDKAGNVYITVRAVSDQVWKFSPAGVKSVLADLGEPGGGALGMTTDAADNVYVCRASVTNEGVLVPNHGVYRIAPDGAVSPLPGTEQIVFPNAVALDEQETLYVTEMFSGDFASGAFGPGGLWRIPKGGTAELWVRHELLTGLVPSLFPFPVGANGIGFYGGALYVANPDKALIVRVPVQPDGSAGQPEIWKTIEDVPESFLYGSPVFPVMIDGLTFDPDGNAYVTAVSRNAIVRIDADDRTQQTVAVYPQIPLDAPANVAFGTDKSPGDSLFITNMGMCKTLIPNLPWPGPGLVKISLPGSTGAN
ncbi:MAG: SMP-30/gluconolactonase/LRE family protein [Planctomycetes bacterium]|nr:SMP-30/gluconolactonase/LRE family protein [Planctomycetota bacterium]